MSEPASPLARPAAPAGTVHGASSISPAPSPSSVGATPTGSRLGWLWIVLAVVAAGLLAWFCTPLGRSRSGGEGAVASGAGGRGGGARGGGRNVPTTVGVAKIVTGDIPITLEQIGTVTPVQTVTVRSQISGQLLSVGFQEGQMVRKGQVLAQIDPRPYEAQLAQAQGNLARDQAQLANARLDLQRYQTLLTQDSIARQQVDTQAALVRQYEGTRAVNQAAIDAIKLNIAYCRIVSPITGRVGLRVVDPGNYISAGDANGIVVVSQLDPIDVLFTIPQDQLPAVSARTRAGASLPVTAFDQTKTNTLAPGRLLTLDNAVDVNTGTVRGKARFPNGSGGLTAGQFVNVRLLVNTLSGVMLSPTAAIQRGQQGTFVYLVKPDRSVTVRPVRTGPSSGERITILQGLAVGDTVVTDGSDRLREGSCVILPGDRPSFGPGGRRGASGAGGAGAGGGQGARGGQGGAGGARQGCGRGGRGGGQAGAGQSGAVQGGAVQGDAAQDRAAQSGGAAAPAPRAGAEQAHGGAQGGQGGGGGGGGRGAGRMIEALGLDAAQAAKAQAIFARHQPSDPEDPEARREARQAAMAELDPILRPDQKAKLQAFRDRMRSGGGGPGGGPQ